MRLCVVMCTHNPRADYIGKTLEGLRAQTYPVERWSFVVVDNHSEEPVESRIDLAWHPAATVVREETLGLTPARLCGFGHVDADLIVLVDDDNVLDPDFLEVAMRIADEHPYLGAWSGQCLAEFDEEPPEWTRRYWGSLCIRRFESEVWSNLPRLADTMPAGAGMCLRASVAMRYLELHRAGHREFQLDRSGSSLLSGGDNDLAACACDIGLGVGLFPQLRLRHLIPPGRLTLDYLCRLTEGIHFSSTILDAQRGIAVHPRSRLGRLADALRVMRQTGPHRTMLRAAYRGRNRAAQLLAMKT